MRPEQLKKLAALARITIGEDELNGLGKDLDSIVDYISQIKEVSGDASSFPKENKKTILRNIMRENKNPHETGAYTEALLGATKETERGYIKVKKIL